MKFFIALIVLLDILHIPRAEEKVSGFAFKLTKNQLTSENSAKNTKKTDEIILPYLPIQRSGVKEPYINAKGAIVIDIPTSQTLLEKNGKNVYPIASLTKIMTAIVALENYSLDDVVTVPDSAPLMVGSKINLRAGEKITVSNLLYGLLLYSGNDAACTLASHIGKEKFIAKMNEKAKQLGLKTLNYFEESGLDQQNSASLKDLALLVSYALRNQTFRQVVKTNETTIYSTDKTITHPLKNTNKLLREYPGTFGVKTGFTYEAGHCLIAVVKRGNAEIMSIVLDSPSDQFIESEKILDWTFHFYTWQNFN